MEIICWSLLTMLIFAALPLSLVYISVICNIFDWICLMWEMENCPGNTWPTFCYWFQIFISGEFHGISSLISPPLQNKNLNIVVLISNEQRKANLTAFSDMSGTADFFIFLETSRRLQKRQLASRMQLACLRLPSFAKAVRFKSCDIFLWLFLVTGIVCYECSSEEECTADDVGFTRCDPDSICLTRNVTVVLLLSKSSNLSADV